MGKQARISGTGFAVPPRILTNAEISQRVDTTDEWIRTRTGIEERRIASEDMHNSDLAAEASRKALCAAGIAAEEIDMIVVATTTSDMPFPSMACILQQALGARRAAVFDVVAACSGFVYALSVARQYVASGECRHVLVTASEVLSRVTDWSDRSTCILFGDGAGAVVLSASDEGASDILAFHLGGDGRLGDLLKIPAGGSSKPASHETVNAREHTIRMNGAEVFKAAVQKMNFCMRMVLRRAGLEASDLDLVIPHQANLRIIDSLRKYLDLPREKVYVNLQKYGNTSAASIAIALAECVASKRLARGNLLGMCAFGGGLTWGACVLRY
ncbi:MAG: ketoacyl-ACP synthase III [Spirochaetota bacterium]|jgi:3-oxoacyl-[acyl-carrier-protein] synthase-3|nr:ketoacyl-ACP synthase III [Spirochaetota bacterium]